jgi:phosphatidylinositol glycan class C protein
MPTTAHVFSLVMLAAGLFAGWPTLAKAVRVSSS